MARERVADDLHGAAALAREGKERVDRNPAARLNQAHEGVDHRVHGAHLRGVDDARLRGELVGVLGAHPGLGQAMRAVGQVTCENRLRVGLGGLYVGLVEGRDLHEPAHERGGVLPQHEVAPDVHGVFEHVGALRHVGREHRSLAVERGVGVGVVHHHGVHGLMVVEQVDVDFDVRHDALAVLAEALCDELLHPQAEDAPRLGRDVGEAVGRGRGEVRDEEARELHGGVVQAVLGAHALHLCGAGHHVAHVQAAQGRRHQAEDRQRREAPAHGGLAEEHAAEGALAGELLQVAARVGDGHEVLAGLLLAELADNILPDDVVQRERLERAARLARHDEDGMRVVHTVQDLPHVHGRQGVERGEAHAGVQGGAELRDGHGRLRAAALAEKTHVVDVVVGHAAGELLDLLNRGGRVACQVGPTHEVARTVQGNIAEVIQRAVLDVHTGGHVLCDESLGRARCLCDVLTSHDRLSNQGRRTWPR